MEMDRRTFLRTTLQAAAGVAGAWALTSCGGSDPERSEPVPTVDPSVPAERVDLRLPGADYGFPSPFNYSPPGYSRMAYLYDTLLVPDVQTDAAQPWLAASVERSPDGLTYTFRLRDGVRWHDGRPLTADDVVFTFDYFRARQFTLPPFLLFRPEHVTTVSAPDPTTVQVQLDLPAVTFPRAVAATFPIVPRHVWETVDDPARRDDPAVLVGSGPYRMESYARGQGAYLFTANDDFFLGRPFVRRIELRPVANELLALRAGQVDAGGPPGSGEPVSGAVLNPFRADPAFGVVEQPHDFPTALYWNLTKGGAPADVRFRQACARAIDRQDLVDRILGGLGRPGNPGFLPPGHPYRVDVEQYRFDRGEANRLLDQAGYRRGGDGLRRDREGRPLRLRFMVLPVLEKVTDVVRDALGKVGIELQPDPVDPFQLFAGAPQYDMAMFFYGGVSGDPDYMRGVYSSRGQKAFMSARGYVNAELDDLADQQLITFDEEERKRIVAEMQRIVARDLPLLHLYYPTPFTAFRKRAFDQFGGRVPFDKQVMVTGLKTGGTTIRPVKEG